jgi:hypothetical protein
MKKSTLKLKLNRETLHALEQPQLGNVAGGGLTVSECLTSCGCDTRNTCTSRYC